MLPRKIIQTANTKYKFKRIASESCLRLHLINELIFSLVVAGRLTRDRIHALAFVSFFTNEHTRLDLVINQPQPRYPNNTRHCPICSFKFELYGVICVYRFVEVSIYFHFVTVNPGNGGEVQIETFLVIFIFINLFVGLISC